MEISLLIKVLESFVHKEGAFKAALKMISWRFYLVFIVVFYSKSVDCSGSSGSSGLYIIVLFVIVFKLVCIAICCYRRCRHREVTYRRLGTASRTAAVNRSTRVTQQSYNPPEQSYNPAQQSYNPPEQSHEPPQDEQGSPSPGYAYPQNTAPKQDDVSLIDLADNPPPPCSDSPSS